jgi:hypothetical protein
MIGNYSLIWHETIFELKIIMHVSLPEVVHNSTIQRILMYLIKLRDMNTLISGKNKMRLLYDSQ